MCRNVSGVQISLARVERQHLERRRPFWGELHYRDLWTARQSAKDRSRIKPMAAQAVAHGLAKA
jgi:hypothetical protein